MALGCDIIQSKPTLRENHSNSKVQGHINGIISKLYRAYNGIMENETRIWMLKSLTKNNISTNDIHAFVKNQAGLRNFNKDLDQQTMKVAMRAKIRDIRMTLNHQYRAKPLCQGQLLRALDGKSYALRKKLKKISGEVKIRRNRLRNKYDKKISHLKHKQKVGTAPSINIKTPTD